MMISFSCKRPDPPKAVITTTDTGGTRLSGITVTIYAQPNGSYVDPQNKVLKLEKKTDSNGEAAFDFNNEAIFNVKAVQTQPIREAKCMIFLKEDEVTRKTLILR